VSRGRARGGAAALPLVRAPLLRNAPPLPYVAGPHLPAINMVHGPLLQSREENVLRASASVLEFRPDQQPTSSGEVSRTICAGFLAQFFSPFLLAGQAWILTSAAVWAWPIA
jgi:hypothetical protein